MDYLKCCTNCLALITGTFPEELLALTDSMEKLFMAYNLFYGPLPTRLGKMSKLEGFYAFGNDFLSTIPSEVGLLKDLKVLGK